MLPFSVLISYLFTFKLVVCAISIETVNDFINSAADHDYVTGGIFESSDVKGLYLGGHQDNSTFVWTD